MNKAFIFDMDGVIVDSENAWKKYESGFFERLLGREINDKVGDKIGLTVNTIYDKAKSFGFTMLREKFQNINDRAALTIYERADLTPDIDRLISFLIKNDFKLGVASSTAMKWIKKVLRRLSLEGKFKSIISLNERPDLQPKPSPDGYTETMRNLDSHPSSAIIIEDSNRGIMAAKASGAFTIAFTQNLVDGYKQIEADAKANNMKEVIEIIMQWNKLG